MCFVDAPVLAYACAPERAEDPMTNGFAAVMRELEQRGPGEYALQLNGITGNSNTYKVWISETKEPSKWSYSCASIYVIKRLLRGDSNVITYWNTQQTFTTLVVCFKLHRGCKKCTLIEEPSGAAPEE